MIACPLRRYKCDPTGNPCEDCRRYEALGLLVQFVYFANFMEVRNRSGFQLHSYFDKLDAIAAQLGHLTRARRRFNKEMSEEQREAQRAARDAYAEGRSAASEDREW